MAVVWLFDCWWFGLGPAGADSISYFSMRYVCDHEKNSKQDFFKNVFKIKANIFLKIKWLGA